MRSRRMIAAVTVLLAFGACTDLTVPDYNNPSLEDRRHARRAGNTERIRVAAGYHRT